MLGNVITSVIAAVGTLIWLEIFSVPYPLLLSVFVGFMDLIPIVGSTVAGIIVSLVALTVSWPVAVGTAVFYIVYRNLEDYLITPKVMNRTVKVSGLITVVAVLIGGALLGIIGALIAIPDRRQHQAPGGRGQLSQVGRQLEPPRAAAQQPEPPAVPARSSTRRWMV